MLYFVWCCVGVIIGTMATALLQANRNYEDEQRAKFATKKALEYKGKYIEACEMLNELQRKLKKYE